MRRFARDGAPHPDPRVRGIAADEASAYPLVLFVGVLFSGSALLSLAIDPQVTSAFLVAFGLLLFIVGFRQRRTHQLNVMPEGPVGER